VVKAIRNAILDVLEERFGVVKKGIVPGWPLLDDPAILRSLHRKSVKVCEIW